MGDSPARPIGFKVFTGYANPGAARFAAEENLLGTFFFADQPGERTTPSVIPAGIDCPICYRPLTTCHPVPAHGGRAVAYNEQTGAVLVAPFPPGVRPLHCDTCYVYFVDLHEGD